MKFTHMLFLLLLTASLQAQKKYEWKTATAAGYTYKYVTNDPTATRFYTLKNGLTVALSPNKKEPRIATRIAVRAGSNTDPKDHTGLAHYLEHVLFKGTDKFGSLDWQKEKPYLDQIDALYEQYNHTTDAAQRKAIYHTIDSVSGAAAKYAIANEYDKMMASIGSQRSNAHTSVEETVYEEDIPSSAIDKFLAVQSERFRNPIFRIFHTELEAVYEEKNRSLDNDGSKVFETMFASLFPTHNYGQQTTIGTIEHLKNPSLKAIREYYYKYYVPNNMAVVFSGDFNPDQMIKKVDAAFSYMQPKPVEGYKGPVEAAVKGPIVKEVYGPTAESMRIAYRVGASGSREALLADLTAAILSNGKAGLLDLNLNKAQKVLGASAGAYGFKDYGVFMLVANPKQGQTLEQVKDILLEQIDKLKKGEFDESLIKAIVANRKLSELQAQEDNTNRVVEIVDQFIKNKDAEWDQDVAQLDEMGKVSKKEIVDFANKFFQNDNYVVIYKRKGEDKSIVKVEKPPITPVETNAGKQSAFVKSVTATPLASTQPVWIDYNKDIQKGKAGPANVLYVPNKDNSLFRLHYYFNQGTFNNRLLPIALQYLQFLGTDKATAEEITKQFYNIAASFSTNAGNEETTITISGLQENFDKAVSLFENLLRNCKVDETALASLKDRLLKARTNTKMNKQAIAQAVRSYAVYGANNPFNYVLTNEEIKSLKAADLVALLHSLTNYKHDVLYYGPSPLAKVSADVAKLHTMPATWTAAPKAVVFKPLKQTSNQVLFTDYDAVQSEIYWVKDLGQYDPAQSAKIDIYNSYFGGGMGSVVFQTIRESKALAYSTFAVVQTPAKKEDDYTFIGYVGSQADKMNDAINSMNDLLKDLPKTDQNFENAIKSEKKDIETQRITKDDIIFNYLRAQKRGLNDDVRKSIYGNLNKLTLADLATYHQQQFQNQPFTYTVIASEKRISMDDLKKYGEVKRLNVDDLFGYENVNRGM
ncbi:M16 family metallopeptidase [Flavisolibacter ginsenosidimutans]|uniref:Insulinase family protein n=1 Tax=Flavisolibacter ginsenosidimutans TaxID=661481 RepID=A0A5B8UN64_9BACT|nr:M16 family metallopeptidase [Flavisolibacter ginsenosidimutans]QEC57886.1 insulinase family protein [Flavisolibacter ginsenosidimutans]